MAESSNAPLRLTGILACIAALSSPWSGIRLGPIGFSDAISLAGVAVLLTGARSGRVRLNLPPWTVALPVAVQFFALLHASLPATDLSAPGIGGTQFALRATLAFVGPVFLGFCIARAAPVWGWRVLASWCVGLAASSVFAIAQSYDVALLPVTLESTVGFSSSRQPGLASHPNALAQGATLLLPFTIFAIFARSVRMLVLGSAGLTAAVWSIFISGSRAGLVVGFIVLTATIVALMSQRRAWQFAPFIGIAVTIVTVRYAGGWIAGTRLSEGVGGNQSDEGRLRAIGRGLEEFYSNPVIGSGPGRWFGEFTPLILLVAGGVPLLAIFLYFTWSAARALWRGRGDYWVAATGLSFLGLFFFGFLNNGVFERMSYWGVLTVAGILAGQTGAARPTVRTVGPRRARPGDASVRTRRRAAART